MSLFPSFSFGLMFTRALAPSSRFASTCVYLYLPEDLSLFLFSNLKSGFLFLGVYNGEMLKRKQKKKKVKKFGFSNCATKVETNPVEYEYHPSFVH